MSKTLFHTITIKIPSEQIYYNRNSEAVKLVPTLTKSGALTKRDKEPSIILKPDSYILHPEIENEGETRNYVEMKHQHTKLKQIKKRLEKLPSKKKNFKEGFKYALSQLPKKRKKSFLSDWLEIKESGKKDKSITKIQSIIYNLLFDIIDSKYSEKEIKTFINSIEIPLSTFDYIQNWVNKKINMGHGIEYSDFVRKVIYPALLKSVPKDTDKIKLMMYANDIACDSIFDNNFLGQKNKYKVMRTFIDHKIPHILDKLKSDSDFNKLIQDLQMSSFSTDRNALWQHPTYKPKYNYENLEKN
jgi:hypothetical protein